MRPRLEIDNSLAKERKGKDMKKLLSLVLALTLLLSLVPAHAATYLGFFNQLGNEAGLDWLEDAHAKAPEEVSKYYNNGSRTYKPSPLLDEYPLKTAVVYRSAGWFGGQTAVRNNTSVTVFVDKAFADLDEAKAFLDSLGLIDLIDGVIGSIVVVTPADGKAFGDADAANYADLHAAMFNQRTTESLEVTYTHADSEYFGAYGKVYLIGIDGGATFINNYIAPGDKWVIGHFAGMLLVNGEMNEGVVPSNYVPAYLVNGTETALNAYKAVNDVDGEAADGSKTIYTNSAAPLRKVIALTADTADLKPIVEDAFLNLFMEAQRLKNVSSPDAVPTYDVAYLDILDAPPVQLYSLSPRNAIFNGVTLKGGLVVTAHHTDMFSDVQTSDGEYLEFWYDALPQDVLDNTAEPASVPLVLALHGTQDDPLMFMDEIGWLSVASEYKIAIISPFTEGMVTAIGPGNDDTSYTSMDGIMKIVLPRLVTYMLETYPALDPARVYVSGYSMGGGSTYRAVYGGTDMFAACAPQAGMHDGMLYVPGSSAIQPEEEDILALQLVGMPTMIMTSTGDLGFDRTEGRLTDNTLLTVDQFAKVNGLEVAEERDFEAYPYIGMPTDEFDLFLLNGEWRDFQWYRYNDAGVPIVGVNCIENLTHSLYPGHAQMAYEYMRHFSRDLDTGLTIYNPD